MKIPSVVIVTPALADANNGNWQTALRWQQLLSSTCHARIVQAWPDGPEASEDVVMIALHARRSASSIDAWSKANRGRGLAVVLTGTDLYGDIQTDAYAKRSLALAQAIVVLQECGPAALPEKWRHKTRVIFQSTTARRAQEKTRRHLRAVMVGHLREEKSPQTLFAAARLLQNETDIFIGHIGTALDPRLGKLARATEAACSHYRWWGGLPHEAVRRRIQRAHVLVHASRVEGGAHVVMEAICSGTPVLASRIPGNVGMLGAAYTGYFEHGNAQELADLLMHCRDAVIRGTKGGLMPWLQAQCLKRMPLFEPAAEKRSLGRLIGDLL